MNKQVEKALEEWLIASYDWKPPLKEAIEGVERGDIEPAYKVDEEKHRVIFGSVGIREGFYDHLKKLI